jgi:hypothetical protein
MKVRDKRRDIKVGPREGWDKGAAANSVIAAEPGPEGLRAVGSSNGDGRPQVYRVMPGETKPMSAEEAIMEIDAEDPYIVFMSSDTNRHAVLLRRPDGNFDLVEC